MAHSLRTVRIVAASFLAVLMVAGAYAASGPIAFFGANIADAQSSAALLREYAAKDTDGDGLADWQEALYGTDPADPESFQAGIKDGEAVAQGLIKPKVIIADPEKPTDPDTIPGTVAAPSSLTDRFAQAFLKQYLLNRGDTPPTAEEIATFVENGVAEFSASSASPDTFSGTDVRASGASGPEALATYAAQAEAAFAAHTVPTDKNELSYFADALRDDDAALKKIKDISSAYANIANALVALPVPDEARQSHLSIVNALMHMSEASGDMASMKTDPLRALLGIGLYEGYANEIIAAFANLNGVFDARQVSIPQGVSGYFIVKTARDAAAAKE